MDMIAPVGRVGWFKIKTEIENQYRTYGKALLSVDEYCSICNSFGIEDQSAQLQLLSVLSTCGSCIAIEDEEFSVLSPNWLAYYLYLFYNYSDHNKALMDYKKEYIPMLKSLNEYSEHRELITDYLEQRGLCTVFFDENGTKKILIPMFLPTENLHMDEFPQTPLLLTYKFKSTIIPEYEFQRFIVREFHEISKEFWNAWQFGLHFIYYNSEIYIELINDGILLKIWSCNEIVCGKCLQWIRNAI